MCCSKNDGIKIILNWIGRVANYNPLAIKPMWETHRSIVLEDLARKVKKTDL